MALAANRARAAVASWFRRTSRRRRLADIALAADGLSQRRLRRVESRMRGSVGGLPDLLGTLLCRGRLLKLAFLAHPSLLRLFTL